MNTDFLQEKTEETEPENKEARGRPGKQQEIMAARGRREHKGRTEKFEDFVSVFHGTIAALRGMDYLSGLCRERFRFQQRRMEEGCRK